MASGRIAALIATQAAGRGLDGIFYSDPEIYARDLAAIFHRHWLCVGHESELPEPGCYVTRTAGGESLILARDRDGVIHAMLNVCRHRGSEVATEPAGRADFFVCPYHAWSYGLDGTLEAARHMPPGFERARHGLRRLALTRAAGLIFVSFAEAPLAFAAAARLIEESCGRYGWGTAKVAHRERYAIAANWKLAVENYVECYHCSPAHPEYSRLHALEQPLPRIAALNARMEARTQALGVAVTVCDLWRPSVAGEETVDCFRYALYEGVATGSADGKPLAPLMGAFADYDGGATSVHVGGSAFLLCYPDHGVIYRFSPKGAEACEMELLWLVRGDAVEGVDYDRARLTWLWQVTSEADKRIIEHTARGVRSRFFAPGPLAPMEYNETRYLDWYLKEIAAPTP